MPDEAENISGGADAAQALPRPFIVLASGSPRRKELLEREGIEFTVRVSDADESLEPDDLFDPREAAKKVAERKAHAVVAELLAEMPPEMLVPERMTIVISADTMVIHEGEIFGKPTDRDDARRMLVRLSGARHEVTTAVSVWLIAIDANDEVSLGSRTFPDTAYVTFRSLAADEIEAYLETGEPADKAGAYAIQGKAGAFVTQVEGSRDTVIGLPVERLLCEFPVLKAE